MIMFELNYCAHAPGLELDFLFCCILELVFLLCRILLGSYRNFRLNNHFVVYYMHLVAIPLVA